MICVNSVSVSPGSITIKKDSWYDRASATVCPTNADCTEVTWHSSNSSVASVNASSGYIYANEIGTARIYATATDGSGCSDYITVTVTNTVSVSSVTLSRSTASLEVGSSITLGATVCPENATNRSVNWSSSNSSVASVSGGVVCALAQGSARITATAADGSGNCDYCTVTVTKDILVTSVTVTPNTKTMTVGNSAFLSATVCPTNATRQSVCWSSSNSSVVTVNPNTGLIMAQQAGTAYVYATACDGSGCVGCCYVTVEAPILVTDITVCPQTLNMTVGETAGLCVTVCPANATNKTIRWCSCNPSVAEVDSVSGCVEAISEGSTCVYANAVDGSDVFGCCSVTVNPVDDGDDDTNVTTGTDSIGVFQTLSMFSTPAGGETQAPVMLGVQFTELQNGNYSMRLVSQIRTLNYKRVGYEIHSKFGNGTPSSNILVSKVAYTSLIAAGETVYPDEGFDYFVVGTIENIPENTIASFNIVPYATTLEGEKLCGDTTLFSFKNAQSIDYVEFEALEHSNTSHQIYHAELSENGDNYEFTCAFSQCNDTFVAPKDQVIGSYVTSSTDSCLGNSEEPLAYGIDVSKHQGEISQSQWKAIANTQIDGHTITFAILRIGTELNPINGVINRQKDETFENNYARAKAAGLQVGCYYYTESWSAQNAIGDAEQVIEWIGDKQFEYPIFFDIESELISDNVSNNTVRTEICTAFMNKMRQEGFFTGFYTNKNWIDNHLNSSMLLPEYDFWYARYYDDTPNNWQSSWAGAGRKFGMWQYTESKNIAPVSGKVDCNVAYKNYPLIIKSLHLNNF